MQGIHDFIYKQPNALRKTLESIPQQLETLKDDLDISYLDHVYLVGSGTSKNALVCLESTIGTLLETKVTITNPVSFVRNALPKKVECCLGVFLSQSGTSSTTVDAMEYAQQKGMPSLVITADSGSPITKVSKLRPIIMPIGNEPVGPKTMGYTASIATLTLIVRQLAYIKELTSMSIDDFVKSALQSIAEMEEELPNWEMLGNRLAQQYYGCNHIMVLASGRHYGTALEGTLKITEMSGIASSAYDIEEGLHGRFHGLDSQSLALFLVQSEEELALARIAMDVLMALGIPCRLIGLKRSGKDHYGEKRDFEDFISIPFLDVPELDLITAIVPLQFFARSLALAKGMVPETMKYPGLSQKLRIKLTS